MSAATIGDEGEQSQAGLFDQGEVPVAARAAQPAQTAGAPRVMTPQRNQIELRAVDLEALLAPDHAARTVWAFVQSMDLAPLYARIKSVAGRGGAPAIDPAILVALWLWATIDGVGSAREVDRLCERDDAYRWICGGVGVNYHSLADFRTEHEAWLDAQLTRSIASLLDRRLVSLNAVAQDGLRVRAHAKASSFRRREKLAELHAQAQVQVQALKRELAEDAGASARRKQAAVERATREREQRLAAALATMDKLQRKPPPEARTPKPSKRRGRKGDDDPGSPDATTAKPEPQPQPQPRVSTTDADARVMKMADGGFRPAFNAQLAVDADTQLIAAVAKYLDLPPVWAYEVATFYSMFETEPVGRNNVAFCTNISCWLNGAEDLVAHAEKKLGCKLGGSTADGRIYLKREEECVAACCGAPVVVINGHYHEKLDAAKVDELLDGLK